MSRSELGWVVLLVCVGLGESTMTRITYPGCDRAGWKCNKVQITPVRWEIQYTCPNQDGIIITLWNFNAPTDIRDLKIVNCTAVLMDLTCTSVGRPLEGLHLQNIGVFNFTSPVHRAVSQMPERVILENIGNMPEIPEKAFKQMKNPLANSYSCAVNTKPVNKIVFRNVNIEVIRTYGFYNLTDLKEFVWEGVTVNKMEDLSVVVEMEKSQNFLISNSTFNKLSYKSFSLKSPNVVIQHSNFNNIPTQFIDSTSFTFKFINNTLKKVHNFGFVLLSQDITFKNNHFEYLKTGALQGMGPGLLENAFQSFGRLIFTYNFNNNTILQSDIGGLHPDWVAYTNVRSELNVSNNFLPCTCKELGWLTLRDGVGIELSKMLPFNAKFLDKNNKNLCLNTPCNLPVTVLAAMPIKFGVCGHQEPVNNICKNYNPKLDSLGLKETAGIMLNKWKRDFPIQNLDSEQDSEELEDLYLMKNAKESYFKIEKSGLTDIDPTDSKENKIPQNEIPEPNSDSPILFPDLVFDDQIENNKSLYKYDIDVRNNNMTMNSTNLNDKGNNTYQHDKEGNRTYAAINDKGFSALKKDYEDGQKDFVKQTMEQWRAERKKRMVYFKVYGKLITLG